MGLTPPRNFTGGPYDPASSMRAVLSYELSPLPRLDLPEWQTLPGTGLDDWNKEVRGEHFDMQLGSTSSLVSSQMSFAGLGLDMVDFEALPPALMGGASSLVGSIDGVGDVSRLEDVQFIPGADADLETQQPALVREVGLEHVFKGGEEFAGSHGVASMASFTFDRLDMPAEWDHGRMPPQMMPEQPDVAETSLPGRVSFEGWGSLPIADSQHVGMLPLQASDDLPVDAMLLTGSLVSISGALSLPAPKLLDITLGDQVGGPLDQEPPLPPGLFDAPSTSSVVSLYWETTADFSDEIRPSRRGLDVYNPYRIASDEAPTSLGGSLTAIGSVILSLALMDPPRENMDAVGFAHNELDASRAFHDPVFLAVQFEASLGSVVGSSLVGASLLGLDDLRGVDDMVGLTLGRDAHEGIGHPTHVGDRVVHTDMQFEWSEHDTLRHMDPSEWLMHANTPPRVAEDAQPPSWFDLPAETGLVQTEEPDPSELLTEVPMTGVSSLGLAASYARMVQAVSIASTPVISVPILSLSPPSPPPPTPPPSPVFPPPFQCFADSLLEGASPYIRGPSPFASNLVLGNGSSYASPIGGVGEEATGVGFARGFTGLYRFPASSEAPIQVYMQTRRYLTRTQTATSEYPASLSAVVRTPKVLARWILSPPPCCIPCDDDAMMESPLCPQVWVDRIKLRVAYQLKDAHGSVRVTRPSAVQLRITLGSSTRSTSCDTQSSPPYYVSDCSSTFLPASWFTSGAAGAASVVVALRSQDNAADVATASGALEVVQQPQWFDSQLRTSTLGNSLSAPSDLDFPTGGIFVTLPSSPVYANEIFQMYM